MDNSEGLKPAGNIAREVAQQMIERNRAQSTRKGGGDQRPDFDVVCFDEGDSIRIGVCWSNQNTGKKAALELDVERMPRTGKLRAWLLPRRKTRKEGGEG